MPRLRKPLDRPRYPALLPCPFCGCPQPEYAQGATNKRIQCSNPKCGVQVRAAFDGAPENRQPARWEAADKWNTRRTPEEYFAIEEVETEEFEAYCREVYADKVRAQIWEQNVKRSG